MKTRPRGLRERQKLGRERRIVRAAARLFVRPGYAVTSMEDIAVKAKLAVGTIYNYFPSKPDLLLAIARRETEELVARGHEIAASASGDPVVAIIAVADILLDGFMTDDRWLWRELLAAAIADPRRIGQRMFELDVRIVALLAELVENFKSRGAIGSEIEAMRAATVIYGIALTWINAWMLNDDMTPATAREEIHRGIEIACNGIVGRIARKRQP
ncbi:MAG: TetR/AcrR family transcriptional regulator [Candidatus Binataceae bacterium]